MGEIVGRETELERVRAVLRRAALLVGEAGIGKTTLWDAGIAAALVPRARRPSERGRGPALLRRR